MSSTPFISVITPTFNRAYILPLAIQSVLSQTYPNFEYLIVDDGSTDNTEQLVKNLKDKRIKYMSNKRGKGPSGARNTGLDIARGKWITYIDDDDEWYPKLLEVMVKNVMNKPDTIFAIPRGKKTLELYEHNKLIKEIDNSNNYPKKVTIQDIVHKTFHFDNIGFMHSKKVIEEGIRFDENEALGALEDWEFALQICEHYPHGLLYVKDMLFHYHQRFGTDGRVSNDTYEKTAIAFEYVYQKHKKDKILEGQKWYPERVKKYTKLHKEFMAGKIPAKYLLPFS